MVPSFVLALFLGSSAASIVGQPALCRITVAAGSARPAISGPQEVVSRARIMDQPDSPLRIVRVDLTGTRIYRGDAVLEIERVMTIEVRNVSDRLLHAADISIDIRTAEGTLTWSRRLTSMLRPGARVTLRLKAGRGRLIAFTPAVPFDVIVGIRRATLDSCTYAAPPPSQALNNGAISLSTPAVPQIDWAAS